MAEPYVGFTLTDMDTDRTILHLDAEQGELFDALGARLARIMGRDFIDNALRLDTEREGIRLSGFAALPTYSRGSSVAQYLFVNGRPVRDKMLLGALRAAYSDVLPRDRHPAAALFIDCDPELVDVNVHPAKAEVRFRDPGITRGLIVTGIRHALAEAGHRASGTVATATLGAMRPEQTTPVTPRIWQMDHASRPSFGAVRSSYAAQAPHDADGVIEPCGMAESPAPFGARIEPETGPIDAPLGAARAQVHENYIIAQTTDGIVIVDQHAAHERLVYERLKAQMARNGVPAQALLIPAIVPLSGAAMPHFQASRRRRIKNSAIEKPVGMQNQTPRIRGNRHRMTNRAFQLFRCAGQFRPHRLQIAPVAISAKHRARFLPGGRGIKPRAPRQPLADPPGLTAPGKPRRAALEFDKTRDMALFAGSRDGQVSAQGAVHDF